MFSSFKWGKSSKETPKVTSPEQAFKLALQHSLQEFGIGKTNDSGFYLTNVYGVKVYVELEEATEYASYNETTPKGFTPSDGNPLSGCRPKEMKAALKEISELDSDEEANTWMIIEDADGWDDNAQAPLLQKQTKGKWLVMFEYSDEDHPEWTKPFSHLNDKESVSSVIPTNHSGVRIDDAADISVHKALKEFAADCRKGFLKWKTVWMYTNY